MIISTRMIKINNIKNSLTIININDKIISYAAMKGENRIYAINFRFKRIKKDDKIKD